MTDGKKEVHGKRVAIVGSRGYPDLEQVRAYVRKLPKGTVVVSGGAVGVDTAAAQEAVRCHLEVVVYDPSYELHGRRAPLVRNELIVEDCDQLIAFHDGKSTGTMHTVGIARKAGKFVELWRAGRDVPTRTVHIKHCSCGGPFGCDLHPEARDAK